MLLSNFGMFSHRLYDIVLGGQTMYGGYSNDLIGMLGKQLDKGRKGMNFKRPLFGAQSAS